MPGCNATTHCVARLDAAAIRKRVCEGLECLDLLLDNSKNDHIAPGEEGLITRDDSKLKAYVIPTNEELLIARDTYRVIDGKAAPVR